MNSQFIVVTAFIPYKGKALILQRAASERFLPHHWEQAGGKVEFSENPLDTLVREVQEEAALAVKPLRPYYVHDYHIGDDRHMVEIAFHCELAIKPKISLSADHQAYQWVTREELNSVDPMTESMRKLIMEGFNYLASDGMVKRLQTVRQTG